MWGSDNVEERLAVTGEIIALAEREKDKAAVLVGHTWRTIALLELGERAKADADSEAVVRLADELRQPFYLWWSLGLQTMQALLAGRLEEAEQLAQQQLLVGQRVQAPDALQAFGVQMALLRSEQGRLQELEEAFQAFVRQYPAVLAWRCGLAGLYRELENRAQAREEFEVSAAHNFTDLPQDQQWLAAIVLLSDACAFLADTRRAAMLYELLLPYAGRVVVIGPGTACYGAASRSLGLLAMALSQWDKAEQHFVDALTINARIQAKSFSVRTQYEYAQMLLARGRRGDQNKALELLDLSLTAAQELGMTSLQAKVHSLRAKVQSGEARSQDPPDRRQSVESSKRRTTRGTLNSGLRTPDSGRQASSLQPPASHNLFRREGEYWTVGYAGTIARLGDAKGLHHIVRLLQEPGREFHVVDLLAIAEHRSGTPVSVSTGTKSRARSALGTFKLTDSHALPDRPAKVVYQRRIKELREELEEAERHNDFLRVGKARAEIDFISSELAAAYGVGRHARKSNNEIEKVRKTVTNRIRTALTKIQRVHPALWRHLFTALKTGTFCSYNPEKPITWQV